MHRILGGYEGSFASDEWKRAREMQEVAVRRLTLCKDRFGTHSRESSDQIDWEEAEESISILIRVRLELEFGSFKLFSDPAD